jgi:glycerate dehydrogenase
MSVDFTVVSIAVTFPADNEEKEALVSVLGNTAQLVFVTDLSPQDRARELAHADVLISWSPGRELQPDDYKAISHVRMMQLLSAGANQVPFSQLPPSLIIASNVGAYSEAMAEHVLAMILATTKNLLDKHKKLVSGVFDQLSMNRMLQGSNCAILGFGGIGKAVAGLLRCFRVKIYALNTTGRTDESVEFIGTLKDLEYVLRLADIAVIALPLTNATQGLIGSRELAWMKDDAILVNVARGQIVDEAALYQKLREYPNFRAAIDAWWIEPFSHGEFRTNYSFLGLPNVLGSPHNSGVVPGSFLRATRHAADNVKRFLNHGSVRGIVNPSDYLQK